MAKNRLFIFLAFTEVFTILLLIIANALDSKNRLVELNISMETVNTVAIIVLLLTTLGLISTSLNSARRDQILRRQKRNN